ncbi:MAG: ankyrin repeat domain-containing protein [Candidatus Thiodiazotropha endolucinida]|nr:ankyrin repeat domain-containing protein [Candidatus Thiodiazotropha endolucinida]
MRKKVIPPRYDALKKGRTHGFGVLLDAVLYEPHKVKDIVTSNPEILYETCWAGENVLHWLAVENKHEEIRLLRSLGSPIPRFALVDAVEFGHLETIITLLELGCEVQLSYCKKALEQNESNFSKRKISIIKSYFSQFGFEI